MDEQFEEGVVTEGMGALNIRTTDGVAGFSDNDWEAWDALLNESGEASVHLESRAVRAVLRSPARMVRAALWEHPDRGVCGIAIMEDSQASSQGVDDFLEGSALFRVAKSWLHRRGGLHFDVRVLGTPLASGPHAYRFAPGVDEFACIDELLATPAIGSNLPSTLVVKDHPCRFSWGEAKRAGGKSLWRRGWVDLEFDPVMVVDIRRIQSWENYLSALRTKARTKIKRILSLSESLEFEPWSLQEIEQHADDLHALYLEVYGRAAFRLGCLHSEDLACFKLELGDDFRVLAVKHEGSLVGFQCSLANANILEAYFVGFLPHLNKSHALYQRMLLEFIRRGIELGCQEVVLGRTALDIKSSLGAEPRRLVLHERMRNPILHGLSRWAAAASAPKPRDLKRAWKHDGSNE
jgi:hypothetical protein